MGRFLYNAFWHQLTTKLRNPLILQFCVNSVGLLASVRKGLTAFFVFSLPLLFYIKNTQFNQTKTAFAVIVISSLYVLWGAQIWIQKKERLRLPVMLFPGLAFLLVSALSLINATSLGTGFHSLMLVMFFFLFYFYIANSVQTKSELCFYLFAALLSVLGSGLYGLIQYYGLLPGRPDHVMGTQAIISSFGNQNFLAEFVNSWLFPSLILLISLIHRWSKAMVLAMVAVGFAALAVVDSTGVWLGVLFALLFLVASMLFSKSTFTPLFSVKGWVIGGVVFVLLVIVLLVNPGPFRAQNALMPRTEQTISQTDGSFAAENKEAFQMTNAALALPDVLQEATGFIVSLWENNYGNIRAWNWWIAYEMFRAHPILGVGLGNYKVEFLNYKEKFVQTSRGENYDFYMRKADQAHNDYVQVAAELGTLGVVAVLFALVTLIWRGIQQLKQQADPFKRFAVLALYAGVLVFCVDALVNFPGHLPASAMNLMLLLGLAHSAYLGPNKHERLLQGTTLRATVIVIALVAVFAGTLAFRDWQSDVYLELGNQYLESGYYRQALEKYERSLALTFHPEEVLFRIGGAHYKLGALDKAESYFERSLNSYVVEDTFWNLAVVKIKKQDFEAAKYYLNRLLAIKPRAELLEQARNVLAQLPPAPTAP